MHEEFLFYLRLWELTTLKRERKNFAGNLIFFCYRFASLLYMILITRGLSFEAGVNYVVINCREFPRVSIALQRDSTVFYGFISWSDCNIFSCLVISECQYFFLNCFLIGGSVFVLVIINLEVNN